MREYRENWSWRAAVKHIIGRTVGMDRIRHLRERLRYCRLNLLEPNAGYDTKYYENIERFNAHCYDLLAKCLMEVFAPRRVVDVGCGSGGISLALTKSGCPQVAAFDYSSDSVQMARERGLAEVSQLDLREASQIPATGDLCLCLEVAEHLPPKFSSRLCRLVADVAPVLVFTAAKPGQTGHLHVNLQPQSFWIEKMAEAGLVYDGTAVERMRQLYGGRMIRDYEQNLMVFRRRSVAIADSRV